MSLGFASDLDDTLSFTKLALLEILLDKFGNPEELSIPEYISKYQFTYNIPHLMNEVAANFANSLINDPEFYRNIPLIDGSFEGLKSLEQTVGIAAYMTIRPHFTSEVSRFWLDNNGFPKAPIYSRPKSIAQSSGNEWKANELARLFPTIRGIVDDNQGLINFLPPDYQGTVILFGHKEYSSNGLNVIPAEDWSHVQELVKELG